MHRVVLPWVVAIIVLIGLIGAIPGRSGAQPTSSPTASPVPTFPIPAEICTADEVAGWEDADVRPPGQNEAAVVPTAELATPEPDPERELYLVFITLPPGKCMPFGATGNQKDGAIVLIVQEGIIDFTAYDYYDDGLDPKVEWGNTAGTVGGPVTLATTERFFPGDWITLDQQVWFTYKSVGGDSTVVLKAVWAAQQPGTGCGGGCR